MAVMQSRVGQVLSDCDKMICYICERIPEKGCRVILDNGEYGTAWADLNPVWDDELGWDLHFETNLPEAVRLRQIYQHFREQDMTSWEWAATRGVDCSSEPTYGELSARIDGLERKIDRMIEVLGRVGGEGEPAAIEPLDKATTLTKSELARHLKISERTVDRLRAGGSDLGEMRIGGVIRFDPNKIKQAIAARKLKRRRP